MNRKIDVGLIGYGIGGQVFHAPVLTATVDSKFVSTMNIKTPLVLEMLPEAIRFVQKR